MSQVAEDSILALELVKRSFYAILLALEETVLEKLQDINLTTVFKLIKKRKTRRVINHLIRIKTAGVKM